MVKIEVLAEVIKQLPIIPWERKIIECEWGMNTDPTRMAILKAPISSGRFSSRFTFNLTKLQVLTLYLISSLPFPTYASA